MRFAGVHHIHGVLPYETPNRSCSIQASPSTVDFVGGHACLVGALGKQGIAHGDELGSVATREQAPHEQQRLILPSTKIAAEVDNERLQAQASPGLGQERRVNFSPARRRPSLRNFV